MEADFGQLGVQRDNIEMYPVGGWRSADDLQRRIIALSGEFPIAGVRFNMKDRDVSGGARDYIDVVVDQDGLVVYGENGQVFKVDRHSA